MKTFHKQKLASEMLWFYPKRISWNKFEITSVLKISPYNFTCYFGRVWIWSEANKQQTIILGQTRCDEELCQVEAIPSRVESEPSPPEHKQSHDSVHRRAEGQRFISHVVPAQTWTQHHRGRQCCKRRSTIQCRFRSYVLWRPEDGGSILLRNLGTYL